MYVCNVWYVCMYVYVCIRDVLNHLQGANKAAPALEGWRCCQHRLHIRINRKNSWYIQIGVLTQLGCWPKQPYQWQKKWRTYMFWLLYIICWECISPASSAQKLCATSKKMAYIWNQPPTYILGMLTYLILFFWMYPSFQGIQLPMEN
jgi:hypothetical protein